MSFVNRFRKSTADALAIKAYNKGLDAKYKGDWVESFSQNKRANELRAGDEATIWNLAIAATALHRWDDARAAWRLYGIRVNDGPGEVEAASGTACVRLNPEGAAEVVWGERIDPARIRILNVPLASSNRKYGDIVINDGAPEGTRVSGGKEYPVFDELGLLRPSTFRPLRSSCICRTRVRRKVWKRSAERATCGWRIGGLCAFFARPAAGENLGSMSV